MMPRSILAVFALCASLDASLAHAVTCAPDMPPVSNPDSAYTDNGDGTVTHQPTGLIWKRCVEGQRWTGSTCSRTAGNFTWAQALTQARNSTFAGQSDWRLPDLKELRSLVEECRFNPSINDTIFPNTPNSYFWSGSLVPNTSSYAWGVYFGYGSAYSDFRSNAFAVRLVRG